MHHPIHLALRLQLGGTITQPYHLTPIHMKEQCSISRSTEQDEEFLESYCLLTPIMHRALYHALPETREACLPGLHHLCLDSFGSDACGFTIFISKSLMSRSNWTEGVRDRAKSQLQGKNQTHVKCFQVWVFPLRNRCFTLLSILQADTCLSFILDRYTHTFIILRSMQSCLWNVPLWQ